MALRVQSVPILPARDLPAAVRFWAGVPRFTAETYDGGDYAFVLQDGVEVMHLGHFPDLDVEANHSGAYVHVPDVEQLHRELAAAGTPTSALVDEPWGMRELRLTDPSGNVVRFGSPVDPR